MRGRVLALAPAAALCIAVGVGAPAHGTVATSERVRALAAEAVTDAAALRRLKRVTTVDGRAVDFDVLLEARGTDLDARLRALAEPARATPATADPASARRQADAILDERRFRPADVPRPFEGLFERIGSWLKDVGEALGRLFNGGVPLSPATVVVIAAIVIAIAAFVAALLVRRRALRVGREAVTGTEEKAWSAREIEAQADAAERSGDLERALRLRFIAGLLRLHRAGLIALRPSLTSGEVARKLGSRDFDELAVTFDRVVYGRRRCSPADVRNARGAWERVLKERRAA